VSTKITPKIVRSVKTMKQKKEKKPYSWALEAYAYNLNYLGGRDQEGDSSSPAQAKS
jgi:hypothetical protein